MNSKTDGADHQSLRGFISMLEQSHPADVVRIAGSTVIGGLLEVGTLSSAGSTQLCLNAANRIAGCSSSLRYKTQVQSFLGGMDIVRRLRPVSFIWKEDGKRDLGLGAEEVARVEPLLAFRNKQGESEGVRYNQLSAVLINAVNEQQAQIAAQQRTIERMQHQINSLTARQANSRRRIVRANHRRQETQAGNPRSIVNEPQGQKK